MAYTKLFSSIVTSTIWSEDDKTRIVWITMLAIADKNGEVQASIPGLARVAGVSVQDAGSAIAKFLSPDPYSRTPDDQGRRIEEIPGGWLLLNHAKYRAMASKDEARMANAERQRRFKERRKRNQEITEGNALVTEANEKTAKSNARVTHHRDIAEAEAEAEKKNIEVPNGTSHPGKPGKVAVPEGFSEFWAAYPRKVGKGDAERAWAKLRPPLPSVIASLDWQRESREWLRDSGQFIPHPATWLNRRGWEDENPRMPLNGACREF